MSAKEHWQNCHDDIASARCWLEEDGWTSATANAVRYTLNAIESLGAFVEQPVQSDADKYHVPPSKNENAWRIGKAIELLQGVNLGERDYNLTQAIRMLYRVKEDL